jgi:predicted DNA-binding helix-hairpin-helix protein
MIVGASPETDFQILTLSAALYKEYALKRVFFSAYIPMLEGRNLPALNSKPPLLREHRLYQADWLMRFYKFEASELLDENNPNFNPFVDPKCSWALAHLESFPVEINTAPYENLLRIPGVGVISAKKILIARKTGQLDFDGLKKLGVVLKRAQYFILCRGKPMDGIKFAHDSILRGLLSDKSMRLIEESAGQQLTLFEDAEVTKGDIMKCLTGQI